eukprot:4968836-Pyramimonas_sp.AAC.1
MNSAQPDFLGERVNLEKRQGEPPLAGPALPLKRRRIPGAAQAHEGGRLGDRRTGSAVRILLTLSSSAWS